MPQRDVCHQVSRYCFCLSCSRKGIIRERSDVWTSRSLDLSCNNIRHAPTLPSLGKVNVLYLVQNKIGGIEKGELDWCQTTLTSLELGGNRIRVRGTCDCSVMVDDG